MRLRVLMLTLLILSLTPCWLGAATVSAKGAVVDAKGAPVPGVSVYAVRMTGEIRFYEDSRCDVPAKTTTGADGRFKFESLPTSDPDRAWTSYYLIAYEPGKRVGWQPTARHSGWEAKDRDRIISLLPLGPVDGKVTNKDHNPIAGALVQPQSFVYPGDMKYWSSVGVKALRTVMPVPAVTSDENGAFHLDMAPQGVRVGYSATKRGWYLDSAWPDAAELVMKPAGDLTGRVIDEKGKPVAGARVELTFQSKTAYTDKKGIYTLQDAAPKDYSSLAVYWADGFQADSTQHREVTVVAGKTTKVRDLIRPHQVQVTGRALDSNTGKPIVGANVTVQWEHTTKINRESVTFGQTKTDKQGYYAVHLVPGKPVSIGAWLNPYRSVYRMLTASGPTKGIDLKMEPMPTAKGKIVDEAGKPVVGASIHVPDATTGKYAPSSSTQAWATSDANGDFEIPVPGNSPTILLQAHKNAPFDLDSSINQEPKLVLAVSQMVDRKKIIADGATLVAKPPRTLIITIVDPTGAPVTDAWVTIRPHTGNDGRAMLYIRSSGKMDKGTWNYDNIVAGAMYDIRVVASGRDSFSRTIPAEGSPGWKDHIEVVMPNR